jgi:hypothetical protein
MLQVFAEPDAAAILGLPRETTVTCSPWETSRRTREKYRFASAAEILFMTTRPLLFGSDEHYTAWLWLAGDFRNVREPKTGTKAYRC